MLSEADYTVESGKELTIPACLGMIAAKLSQLSEPETRAWSLVLILRGLESVWNVTQKLVQITFAALMMLPLRQVLPANKDVSIWLEMLKRDPETLVFLQNSQGKSLCTKSLKLYMKASGENSVNKAPYTQEGIKGYPANEAFWRRTGQGSC